MMPPDIRGAPFDFNAQGLKPGDYILFACGRLESIKGLHHLLDAYIDGYFAEKLLVVGDFSHDAEYSSRMLEACRRSPMTVVKQELLSMAVLAEVIRNCKVFVFPSEQEAMSMMLLEVISCRRPVVCSDIEENLDVVGRDYPYLFRSGDSADLRRVLHLALSEARVGPVAEALLATCALRFDWRVIAGIYVSLYERAGMPSGSGSVTDGR
ncbi:MAG: glycosyltransferase family 4 protein [Verrucomicrobia bacterium]|nr:glycosyltransferase family 4 protein [Verrucomicrobiota bacterium]